MKRGSLTFYPPGGTLIDIALMVPETPQELAWGLQSRAGIGMNEGMLFLGTDMPMWMAQVKFPLLMIWLDDRKISGYVQAQPGDTGMKRGRGVAVVEVHPALGVYLSVGTPYSMVVA